MYTIYTSPGCGPCMTVKAHLRAHKIPHTLVDVSQDPAAVEKLRKMGYSSAPVTVDEATGEHWHGYLPDRYASPAPEAAPAADMQATIDLGPVEAGEHVLWDPHQGHLLIIGDRDSGKSVIQRGIMETAVSVGWQAWGLGLPGELDKVEDHRYAQVVTADVSAWISRSVGAAGNDGTGHGEPGRDNPGHDDTGRYDVMWFDPPYDLSSTKMDELIARATGLLVDSGLLVVERSARTAAPTFPEGMEHWSSSYGQTVVHYAQRADPSQ